MIVSVRGCPAGDGCNHRRLLDVKLGFGARARQLAQRARQASVGKTLSDFQHSGQSDIQGQTYFLVCVAFGELSQDPCAGDHACAVDALVDEGKQVLLLVIAELDFVG